jgi:hypothetical protein
MLLYCQTDLGFDFELDRGLSDMRFDLDGVQAGTFSHTPRGGGRDYVFNKAIFTSDPLPMGQHNLTIHNGLAGGPLSLLMLDSIRYTYVGFLSICSVCGWFHILIKQCRRV